jgi:hypothetical protein
MQGESRAQGCMAGNDCTAVQVADSYMLAHLPDFDRVKNPPVVLDKDGVWEVHYRQPPNVHGGTPIIVIDKKSKQVTRAYLTQ